MGEEGVRNPGEDKVLEPLIYVVTTKRFNEALKRNRDRFPDDFAFRLSDAEFADLRALARPRQAIDLKKKKSMWSQFATTYSRRRRISDRPWAFTEHGALMAASVLRSDRASRMSIFVIRVFVRLREEAAARVGLLKRIAEIDNTLIAHDDALRDLYQKLLPLLAPPSDPPRRRIGFHADDA